MHIIRVEKILSILVFIALWAALAAYAGGPIFSDELLYINTGLNNSQVPDYGNRYFHVYMQKLFMELAPNPLMGVKVYWAFLIAATALLVYWNARLFSKNTHIVHGLLGVAFFFSYRMISEYSGVPAADIAAMFMVTVLVSVYLFHQRATKGRKWALFLLGLISFLAFKTKETALIANVILLGLVFDTEGKFNLGQLKPVFKPFLLGILAGIGVFIILDAVILRNPFFAISPATIQAVFQNYAYTGGFRSEPTSWYSVYLLKSLMMPFLLYLLSGTRLSGGDIPPQKRVIWLFPLVLVAFITLNMLKIPWGFIERFYFPALPVISMLAPQFLNFELPEKCKDWLFFGLIVTTIFILFFVLRTVFMMYVDSIDWNYGKFLESIYYPILLSILLGVVIWKRRYTFVSAALPIFCIISLLVSPLLHNYKYVFKMSFTGEIFEKLYYPFLIFKQHIPKSERNQMYISMDIYTDLKMLSDDPYELIAMYNLLFDARAQRGNVTVGYQHADILEGITSYLYDFVIITEKDWEYIQAQPNLLQSAQDNYEFISDPQELLIFMKQK
ncbi:MAG TPA: hypothetical protein G4N92_05105 [Anaerolineae bacterium]|nr:hypothetical protein [Anaerolineae bacterium]